VLTSNSPGHSRAGPAPCRDARTRVSRIRMRIVAYDEHALEKQALGAWWVDGADIHSGEYKRSCLDRDEE